MWTYNCDTELYHYGVLGMKWGVRKKDPNDIYIRKGSDIHRIVPKNGLKKRNNILDMPTQVLKKKILTDISILLDFLAMEITMLI